MRVPEAASDLLPVLCCSASTRKRKSSVDAQPAFGGTEFHSNIYESEIWRQCLGEPRFSERAIVDC